MKGLCGSLNLTFDQMKEGLYKSVADGGLEAIGGAVFLQAMYQQFLMEKGQIDTVWNRENFILGTASFALARQAQKLARGW